MNSLCHWREGGREGGRDGGRGGEGRGGDFFYRNFAFDVVNVFTPI